MPCMACLSDVSPMGLYSAAHRYDVDHQSTSNRLKRVERDNDMATTMFYGWKIVLVCFLIAMFGFGFGFYGLGLYLVSLQSRHGWPSSVKRRKIYGSDPDQKLHLLVRAFLAGTCVKNQTVRRTRFQGFLATLSGAALRRLPANV